MHKTMWLIGSLGWLAGCAMEPVAAPAPSSMAEPGLKPKLVAGGLVGECPRGVTTCEIFLTIIDNPDTRPEAGGPGRCEVAVPVKAIFLRSTPADKQTVVWRILNANEFEFTSRAIDISPNKAANGRAAFDGAIFTVPGMTDRYQWQSTGWHTSPTDPNGYVAYVRRKAGALDCGTKDPLIANMP